MSVRRGVRNDGGWGKVRYGPEIWKHTRKEVGSSCVLGLNRGLRESELC